MRAILAGISILLLFANIFLFIQKTTKIPEIRHKDVQRQRIIQKQNEPKEKKKEKKEDEYGYGQASDEFDIHRGFLGVAIGLSDDEVSKRISEASGCKEIQSKLIKEERIGDIRHYVYERIIEIDIAGNKRQIKIKDESKANISKGWIENTSQQISHDDIVRNQMSETRFTRAGSFFSPKTHVEMWSSIEIKGVSSLSVTNGVKSGIAGSRAEMIRQLQ